MKRLFLLRHGRADPGGDDAVRPLAERGVQDIKRLGRFLAHQNLLPDGILCSTAIRARQTADILTSEWPHRPQNLFLPELYLAEPETILAAIRYDADALIPHRTNAATGDLMLIGHNPGLGRFARRLDEETHRDLATAFPTSALALFSVPAGPWHDWDGTTAHLERFIRRGDLYAEE